MRDASMLEGTQRGLDLCLMEKHPKIPLEESSGPFGIWERDQRVVNLPLCNQGTQLSPSSRQTSVCSSCVYFYTEKLGQLLLPPPACWGAGQEQRALTAACSGGGGIRHTFYLKTTQSHPALGLI